MRLLITILIIILSISNVYSQECKFVTKNNQELDFSALDLDTDSPYTYKSSVDGMSFVYNFCGMAPYCTSNTKDLRSSICSINSTANPPVVYSFGDYSRGQFSDLPSGVSGIGAQLTYPGDPNLSCGGAGGTRNSYLNLICADVTQPKIINIIEPWNKGVACQLTLTIQVPCPGIVLPKAGGIGGGWIFIIILLSTAVAYIVFGSIINWKVRHQHGAEIFPNLSFWKGFGGYIKDGVGYIKSKVTGTPGGDYSQI